MAEKQAMLTIAKKFGDKALVVTSYGDTDGQISQSLASIPDNTPTDPCLLMQHVKGNIETMHVEPVAAAESRNPQFV